jgi:hypothetical protein
VLVFFLVVMLIGSSTSSSFWWTFEGLDDEHLPESTVVRNFKQLTMNRGNGATGASSIGPFAGYNLISEFVKFSVISLMINVLHVYVG